jgi:hypothetical protein
LYFILTQDGSEAVKSHPWFNGVDWNAVLNRTITAPIVPVAHHPGDSRNFDNYPEISNEEAPNVPMDTIQHLFAGF